MKQSPNSTRALVCLQGTSGSCVSLKLLVREARNTFCCSRPPNEYEKLDAKLEKKVVEIKRSASTLNKFRSIDSVIMRFPKFREGLRNIIHVFQQFDEDSNGAIDREELKKSFQKLEINLTEEEVQELFHSCDMDKNEGIHFNEFIVLLFLIFLLAEPSALSANKASKLSSPQFEATFDTVVQAFLFLDKDGDGKLKKHDMVKALNEASPWERSPAHITRNRFKEMDWKKKGTVGFREFLFAFIDWVGIDDDDEVVYIQHI